jgi:hypothetical protein
MAKDARRCVPLEGFLHDLSRMNARTVYGSAKEFLQFDDPMSVIQVNHTKHLMLQRAKPQRQIVVSRLRRRQRRAATQPARQLLPCRRQNLRRRAEARVTTSTDRAAIWHIAKTKKSLRARRRAPHPKIAAVSSAIQPLLDDGEKVLVFCHHRATASELLSALERLTKTDRVSPNGPPEAVWRAAWKSILPRDPLVAPIIDWLCTPGLRRQIAGWLGTPATTEQALAEQLATTKPRSGGANVPAILDAAKAMTKSLLDRQSTSTRALLTNIANRQHTFGGRTSHFPGRLDDGLRVMGAWAHDGHSRPPKTLYTGKPDIVLAQFNSPFGPDVLVTTDRLSEGVDLHRFCRHLIHYELDPSPVRTLQRNGRVRRIGSWAAQTGQPICYAYPTFSGTRDENAVRIMRQRIGAFGLLLGGVPSLDDNSEDRQQGFVDAVLSAAGMELTSLNRKLCA